MRPRSPQILSLVMTYLTLPLSTPSRSLSHTFRLDPMLAAVVVRSHIPFSRCNSIFCFPYILPYIRTSTTAHKHPIRVAIPLPDLHPLVFSFSICKSIPLPRRQSSYSRSLGTHPGGWGCIPAPSSAGCRCRTGKAAARATGLEEGRFPPRQGPVRLPGGCAVTNKKVGVFPTDERDERQSAFSSVTSGSREMSSAPGTRPPNHAQSDRRL